eukprot:CAMPEP_0173334946 /NCGR_PEP_ID=MMETSP1144-20121109/5707_1 /TAXON_ID=483371 /ORGANISM="non described non described, Strain CCMP2298" /LENGTH=105 /DNA_ID=CAMNT_0014280031 /DNA_START=341 /DNA_END=658 /DNA_ORIENTATION=+
MCMKPSLNIQNPQFKPSLLCHLGKTLPIKNIPGPEGVRGRNSDNTLIKARMGWAPSISLFDGMKRTHAWIKSQVELEISGGKSASAYSSSEVVVQVTDSLDTLHK